LASLGASAALGRAFQLRDKGRKEEAMSTAREALANLAEPHVVRTNFAVSAALVSLTVLVEELASETKLPGADVRDISDALSAIRMLGSDSEFGEWIPYLEWRLGQGDASAV
jgi:hypothetical protein